MVQSLGFYIWHAKMIKGKSLNECQSAMDYHLFLAPMENDTKQFASSGVFAGRLKPLSHITLPEAAYQEIVVQIFNGVNWAQLNIAAVDSVVTAPKIVSFSRFYENYLRPIEAEGDRRTREAVESTVGRMAKLVSDPNTCPNARIAGLVVGRVQSGKTRNYIGFMLRAIADGWNVIIALTSDNTALAKQTRDRIYGSGTGDEPMGDLIAAGVTAANCAELDFRTPKVGLPTASALQSGTPYFYFGVAMKEKASLARVHKWFEDNAAYHGQMRVLVIDDEADNATPDSKAGANDDKFTSDDVDELVEGIHDEDEKYNMLADWVEALTATNLPDKDDTSPAGKVCNKLRDTLKAGATKPTMDKVLANTKFKNLLGLGQALDAQGNVVDLAALAAEFFCETKGGTARARKNFPKLLQYMCDVSITRSQINNQINRLVDKASGSASFTYAFPSCAYIGYTATPYACILNERPDETEIYPAFIRSLDKSPQYFGLDAIFGQDVQKKNDSAFKPAHMPIVRNITQDDLFHILHPLQGVKDAPKSRKDKKKLQPLAKIDDNLEYVIKGGSKKGWDSMRVALAWAVCTAGARRHARLNPRAGNAVSDKLEVRWTTMLVNISQKQAVHEKIQEWLKKFFAYTCRDAASKAKFMAYCKTVWQRESAAFKKAEFDRLFNTSANAEENYGQIEDYPTWATIKSDVEYFVDGAANGHRVHVIVINCKNKKSTADQDQYNQVDGAPKWSDDHLWIVSGGNTISRGLTLLGLTASYFDRVRKTVAVDTMTQMGRWFGYRRGYELLPRLWLTPDTVEEMKKTAVLEARMHDSIKDNFDAEFSPAETSHYQLVYSFGRRLSGRARAQRDLTIGVGTVATTNDLWIDAAKTAPLWTVVKNFLTTKVGSESVRPSSKFEYNQTHLWQGIHPQVVSAFLTDVSRYYPERGRLVINSLLAEIENDASAQKWDVVIGEPVKHKAGDPLYDLGVGMDIHGSSQDAVSVTGDVAHYTNARFLGSYLAAIPKTAINFVSAKVLKDNIDHVTQKAEEVLAKGGRTASALNAVLPAAPTAKDRLVKLADDIINAVDAKLPEKEFPAEVRELFRGKFEGFRGRTSMEFFNAVHEQSGHLNPTLQIYIAKPPSGHVYPAKQGPIAISFFWPRHEPDEFHAVSVGLEPAPQTVSNVKFYKTVEQILVQRNFPMKKKALFAAVKVKLGDSCAESKFDALIANPPAGYSYTPVEGMKGVYCAMAWSPVPYVRLYAEWLMGSIAILQRDARARSASQLIRAFVREPGNELFADFLDPNNKTNIGDLNMMFDNSKLHQRLMRLTGLEIVKRRPITYKFMHNPTAALVWQDTDVDETVMETVVWYLKELQQESYAAAKAANNLNLATPVALWKSGRVGVAVPLPPSDEVVFATLDTEPYEAIRDGVKRIEYREAKQFWDSRLMDKRVAAIKFSLGYSPIRMTWEVTDIKRTKNGIELDFGTKDPDSTYEIFLGKRLA